MVVPRIAASIFIGLPYDAFDGAGRFGGTGLILKQSLAQIEREAKSGAVPSIRQRRSGVASDSIRTTCSAIELAPGAQDLNFLLALRVSHLIRHAAAFQTKQNRGVRCP